MGPEGRNGKGLGVGVALLLLSCSTFLVWTRCAAGRAPVGLEPFEDSMDPPASEVPSTVAASTRARADRAPFLQTSGVVRIGAPPLDVPYLGEGRLVLEMGRQDAPSELAESIRAGRFELSLPEGATARIREATLQGHLVALLETPTDLTAGKETILYCAWVNRELRLHVRDATTGKELPRVVVHAVMSGLEEEDGFGVPPRGPSADDPVFMRGSSPVELPLPSTGGHPEYWLVHDGFVPFRFRVPTGLPVNELDLHLTPAPELEISVEGLGDMTGRIAAYEVSGPPVRPVGRPLRVEEALPETRLTGLQAGTFAIVLEEERGGHPGLVLDSEIVDLRPGEATRILLTAHGGARSNAGTVLFRFERDARELGAAIVPLSLEAQRLQPRDALEPAPGRATPEDWGPIELTRGEYLLQVAHTCQVFRFVVGEGETQVLQVPVRSSRDFFVAFVDSRTNALVRLRSLSWSAPMDFSGQPDRGCEIASFNARSRELNEVHAPAGPLFVVAFTEGYGVFEGWIDLGDGIDATVPLEPLASLRVRLGRLDQSLTSEWLAGTRLSSGSEEVPILSTEVRIERGTVFGQIYFQAKGRLDVVFCPLSSYGDIRPGSFDVEPGLVQELVLQDWIVSTVP